MMPAFSGKDETVRSLFIRWIALQDLEVIAYVDQFIHRILIENPGLDFMIINTVGEQRHQYAILNVFIGIFRLILPDLMIDLVDRLSHKHFLFFGNPERDFTAGYYCFNPIHTRLFLR